METNELIKFFTNISRINMVLARKLEWPMNGIGWTDFLILQALMQSKNQKLRRIDLANSVGLTASGVTRILLPMEKIWLISREISPDDARVSYVILTNAGKIAFLEASESVKYFLENIINISENKEFLQSKNFLEKISHRLV